MRSKGKYQEKNEARAQTQRNNSMEKKPSREADSRSDGKKFSI
jgi:hypothetical protein